MEIKNEQVNEIIEGLWDLERCGAYIGKSSRWVWNAVKTQPDQPGSIPHVRIGASARFIPEEIKLWVRNGCPPAATMNVLENSI